MVSETSVSLTPEAFSNRPAVWPLSPPNIVELSTRCDLAHHDAYNHTQHVESICYNGYRCGLADMG